MEQNEKKLGIAQLNVRVALTLLSVALIFFFGVIAKYILFPVS